MKIYLIALIVFSFNSFSNSHAPNCRLTMGYTYKAKAKDYKYWFKSLNGDRKIEKSYFIDIDSPEEGILKFQREALPKYTEARSKEDCLHQALDFLRENSDTFIPLKSIKPDSFNFFLGFSFEMFLLKTTQSVKWEYNASLTWYKNQSGIVSDIIH